MSSIHLILFIKHLYYCYEQPIDKDVANEQKSISAELTLVKMN